MPFRWRKRLGIHQWLKKYTDIMWILKLHWWFGNGYFGILQSPLTDLMPYNFIIGYPSGTTNQPGQLLFITNRSTQNLPKNLEPLTSKMHISSVKRATSSTALTPVPNGGQDTLVHLHPTWDDDISVNSNFCATHVFVNSRKFPSHPQCHHLTSVFSVLHQKKSVRFL